MASPDGHMLREVLAKSRCSKVVNGGIKIKDINTKDWFAQVNTLKVPECSHVVNKGKCPDRQGSSAALSNRI